jgi:hypothetical protein
VDILLISVIRRMIIGVKMIVDLTTSASLHIEHAGQGRLTAMAELVVPKSMPTTVSC